MTLLATIKPEDVDDAFQSSDYSHFKVRHAVRAIAFDRDKVALIRVAKHDYYMLPGGGVDVDTDKNALARELREELGVIADVSTEVGSIEVYIDRWQKRQIDRCFIVHKTESVDSNITDFEKQEDHEVIWIQDLKTALELVAAAAPKERDGKLVQARDSLFLQHAFNILNHT